MGGRSLWGSSEGLTRASVGPEVQCCSGLSVLLEAQDLAAGAPSP